MSNFVFFLWLPLVHCYAVKINKVSYVYFNLCDFDVVRIMNTKYDYYWASCLCNFLWLL
ncbi:hypothetical protein AMTRI_Chr02g260640 [Amborella trichopoda]